MGEPQPMDGPAELPVITDTLRVALTEIDRIVGNETSLDSDDCAALRGILQGALTPTRISGWACPATRSPGPTEVTRMGALIRRLMDRLDQQAPTVGYWLRPYDMLADQRRWRWQPSMCCRCGRRHR